VSAAEHLSSRSAFARLAASVRGASKRGVSRMLISSTRGRARLCLTRSVPTCRTTDVPGHHGDVDSLLQESAQCWRHDRLGQCAWHVGYHAGPRSSAARQLRPRTRVAGSRQLAGRRDGCEVGRVPVSLRGRMCRRAGAGPRLRREQWPAGPLSGIGSGRRRMRPDWPIRDGVADRDHGVQRIAPVAVVRRWRPVWTLRRRG
jgi:hypothetical protein